MTRFRLAVVLGLLLSLPAFSDESAPRDVSAELKTIVVQSGVPGLIGGVINEHGLVALGAAGVRRKGSPALIAKNDLVHLGSCSKAMTATLIAILVEDGAMSWKGTVGAAFPELRETMDEEWWDATVTHLLTHSSGMPEGLNAGGLWDRLWTSTAAPTDQRMELVRGVVTRAPEARPGTKYIYSNAGYAVAGAMAERAAGQTYEDLMRTRLFDPLGMSSAGFGAPGTPDRLDQPRGHTEKGASVEPGPGADNPPAIAPAATVHCSLADWAKFVQLHLNAEMGSPYLLRAESFRTLHSTANHLKPEYAMGWGIVRREWAGGNVFTHNGTNTMWFCVVWMVPQKGMAVLVACNQGGKKAEKTIDEAAWILIQQELTSRRDKTP
jgi:CubicO group peptidase (beta-lactamase class C family)